MSRDQTWSVPSATSPVVRSRVEALPEEPPAWKLTNELPDRQGLLALTAGVMADHGLSIRSASADTGEGFARQELEVVLSDGAPEPNWGVIGVDLRARLLDDEVTKPRPFHPEGEAEVRIVAQDGAKWAVHVSAPDALGLLAAATGWLSDRGFNVETAEVGSEFGWAFDTFVVSTEGVVGLEPAGAARRMGAFLSGHQAG